MKKLAIILLAIVAISCSPQKRLNRKIDRAEKFARKHALMITDTIMIHDTLIIENYTHDTTQTIVFHDSTIVVNNEKVYLKYYYDTLRQEIYHEVICKGDTIIREIPVVVEKIKHVKSNNWVTLFVLCLVLFFVALISYKLSKKGNE